MKIRQSFVSNSSSSSFVVQFQEDEFYVDEPDEIKQLLTEKQISKLIQFEYKPVFYSNPAFLEFRNSEEFVEEECNYLGKSVACNQDQEAEFLIVNNIPFQASVHYGHESWFWKPKDKEVTILLNPGMEAFTYGLRRKRK